MYFLLDCGSLPTIDNGQSALDDATNSTYGASASVICDTGFETNTSVILCLASGEWDNSTCTPKGLLDKNHIV